MLGNEYLKLRMKFPPEVQILSLRVNVRNTIFHDGWGTEPRQPAEQGIPSRKAVIYNFQDRNGLPDLLGIIRGYTGTSQSSAMSC